MTLASVGANPLLGQHHAGSKPRWLPSRGAGAASYPAVRVFRLCAAPDTCCIFASMATAKLQQQAAELQRAGERLPGVADLVKLYQQHAKTVERAGAFQGQPGRRIVITSGDSSA